jgi:uncharacterized membrane protein YbaN (DUF454 family)
MLTAIGVVSVGLAIIGVFVPLLPTTPFLLLAAACFMRSSDRLYRWLVNHRWLGPYVRNYYVHRAITARTKAVSLTLMWATIAYAVVQVASSDLLRLVLLLVAAGVTIHILRMKTLDRRSPCQPTGAKKGEPAGG